MTVGNPCVPVGINSEGLKRRGFTSEDLNALKDAYKTIYRSGMTLVDACEILRTRQQAEPGVAPALQAFLDFFAVSTRGLLRP
jgi:UDP-N-acetylglucosamine acyltransferase